MTNGTAETANVSSTFQPYRYNELGVSLEHPPDWKFASLKNGIQLIKEKNGVYVEIREHNLESSNAKLKQYVFDDIKERSTERQDFGLFNITATTISGNLPAYRTEYTFLKTEDQKDFTSNGPTNKILRFWTFADGNAYTVAYVSETDDYDLYLPIALKIIDTLKINPVSQQSFSDNDSKDNSNNNDDSKDNSNNNDDFKDNGNDDDDSKDNSNDDDDSKDNSNNNDDDDSKDNSNNDDDSKDDSNDDDDDFEDKDGDGDIDCKDTGKNVKVGSDDPYDLDRDGDGTGCDG